MIVLKDGGHGITEESLRFWNENKNKIGVVKFAAVTEMPLYTEKAPDGDYKLEYNMAIHGKSGSIYLSGCNCGYGGTGPHGTAKILAELGLPIEEARQATLYKTVYYNPNLKRLVHWAPD